jgi:hypothetical protein
MELTAADDALDCCAEEGTASAQVVDVLRALRRDRTAARGTRRAIDVLLRRATGR